MDIIPHPTRPGLYVTADGAHVLRELAASPSGGGYHTVKVGSRTVRRHTLICETFHGPRPPGMETRHLDGDPGNDHPDNLTWGTHQENAEDTIRHGRVHTRAKLSWPQALDIRERALAGERGIDLAAEYGVTPQSVADIKAGRTWSKEPTAPVPPEWWLNHPNRGKGHH